ncbi:hypothetical protein K0810_06760 [Erysipelothrix rhusiopathiae]|uniref:Uncharacterized protein n=2 Tax=Erysipelothrix rhusiopathiae TaxID=1648 RepID=E7FTV2_ERYRH|nr:hypothetical protein [Erysipelothrix rhusiopathiae]AMS11304.1 hypothetical protein A2I91_06005 [Erysipelothrix rhusiopathiae]AOO67801.1 hypothetical protein BC346_05525 [Erysipelothrix rhusiopathiae]AWU41340.1 hypothetical protein DM789_03575 [Erysipelothrix rhusiopathiae]EFY09441.1 hypothetical protein HMPREF0357_10236 [Erysipelothrix rhusiopathiae ATCC 19414]MDE8257373.1 hypothetical protein [Erysipelothrix rhusiopathiae]
MKKNALYSIIVAIIINVISSVIYALIEKINFIEAFLQIWEYLFELIANILNFEIKIWQLIVPIILLCVTLYIIALKSSKSNTKISKEYMEYISGKYKDIHYKWTLDSYNNVVSINRFNFRPVCGCGGELTFKRQFGNMHFSSDKLFCVNCEKLIDGDYNHEIHNDALLFFSNNLGKKIEKHNRTILDES